MWTKAAAWMGAVLGVIGILGEWVPFWALGLAMIASALLARVLPAARRLEAAIASCDQQLGALEERRVEIAGEAAELAGFPPRSWRRSTTRSASLARVSS